MDSPLIEWEYYGNRTAEDFEQALDLRQRLQAWMFCTDLSFCDLFFAGFRAGAPAPAGAAATLAGIRRHYRWRNLRDWPALRRHLLIRAAGERRYILSREAPPGKPPRGDRLMDQSPSPGCGCRGCTGVGGER